VPATWYSNPSSPLPAARACARTMTPSSSPAWPKHAGYPSHPYLDGCAHDVNGLAIIRARPSGLNSRASTLVMPSWECFGFLTCSDGRSPSLASRARNLAGDRVLGRTMLSTTMRSTGVSALPCSTSLMGELDCLDLRRAALHLAELLRGVRQSGAITHSMSVCGAETRSLSWFRSYDATTGGDRS